MLMFHISSYVQEHNSCCYNLYQTTMKTYSKHTLICTLVQSRHHLKFISNSTVSWFFVAIFGLKRANMIISGC